MKKKILLICKEKQSLSFYNSLEKLSKDFIIDALFFMPHEDSNSYFHKLFKKNNYINKIYNLNYLIKIFFDKRKKPKKYNIDHLIELENNFKDFKNIRMQLNASQMFSNYFHDRKIYKDIPNDDQLLFYEMYYNEISKILKDSKPDYIFDNDISEFRAIIYEISKQLNIPYISVAYSYYKEYFIPNFNLLAEPDQWILEKVSEEKENNNYESILSEDFKYEYIEDFKNFFSLNAFVFAREIKNFLKGLISILFYFKSDFNKPPFGAKPIPRTFLNLKILIKKFLIKKIIKFNSKINLDEEKYVLLPLHVAPEGSTFTISPLFLNEVFIIELISNCLPVNFKILIKEHPNMVGERSLNYYKKLKSLPNVEILHPYSDYNIKELIKKSSAVITISGTSGMESLILNKPVIVFSKVGYSFLDGCYIFKNIYNFKSDLKKILCDNKKNTNLDLLKYISVIIKYGRSFNFAKFNTINKYPKNLIDEYATNFVEIFKTGIKLSEDKKN